MLAANHRSDRLEFRAQTGLNRLGLTSELATYSKQEECKE